MVNTTQQSVTVLRDAHECPVKNSVIATCAYYLLSLHCLPLDKPGLVFSSTHYYAKTVIRFSLSGLVQFNQSKLLQPFLVYYMLPPNDLTFSSWEKSLLYRRRLDISGCYITYKISQMPNKWKYSLHSTCP